MDCQQVREKLPALQTGRLAGSEQRKVSSHLAGCDDCMKRLEAADVTRAALRSLPARELPGNLMFALRAMASREAERRRSAGLKGFAGMLGWRFSLMVNNLMRPLALPAAGGLLYTIFLFSVVVSSFHGIVRQPSDDVPISIATEATLKSSLLNEADGDIFVDVFVDENGRVIDYSFPEGFGSMNSSQLRRKLENSLLFTEFHPATTFGIPTSGWVRVKFRGRSVIDVQG